MTRARELKAWAGHSVFAAVLIGSLAAQERPADSPTDGASLLEPAIIHIAGTHGLKFREYRTMNGILTRTLIFDAPSCSQPVQVSLRLATFEEKSLMESGSDSGYTRRFIYFDRSWDRPNPRAAFVQHYKYSVLAMFGLTEYVPSNYLILVETPKNCQAVEAVDWRSVWNRDYLCCRPERQRCSVAMSFRMRFVISSLTLPKGGAHQQFALVYQVNDDNFRSSLARCLAGRTLRKA